MAFVHPIAIADDECGPVGGSGCDDVPAAGFGARLRPKRRCHRRIRRSGDVPPKVAAMHSKKLSGRRHRCRRRRRVQLQRRQSRRRACPRRHSPRAAPSR